MNMKHKILIGILVLLLTVGIVSAVTIISFSGRIESSEQSAFDFCANQIPKECNNADYLDNEEGKAKDCKLIDIFDVRYYMDCREDNEWKSCYELSNIPFCLESGAD